MRYHPFRVGMLRICCFAIALLAILPGTAQADGAWNCAAGVGTIAAGDQRADAPRLGGEPCPVARAEATGVTGAPGSLTASGALIADGGAAAQTVDTRQPSAAVEAESLAIRTADGRLVLTASGLSSRAAAACAPNRRADFTTSGSPGTVALNGKAIDTRREYSEPGVGVNGAPLFGKITVRFNEVATSESGIGRTAIHLIVTDRDGVVVFEAFAGQAGVGRTGAVCDPPPVCPPGQEPRAGRCVDVEVTPLPEPPPPAPPLPPPLAPPSSEQPRQPAARSGCAYANARAGEASTRRLGRATFCLLNAERRRRRLARFRMSAPLGRAAGRHARDMVKRRYFSHTTPNGSSIVDRILQSGYLARYGSWRIGENLGWGWGKGATPRAIVAAWMKSPPHRRNILNRRFRDVGVAVVLGSPRQSRAGSITYVLDFGGFKR